MPQLLKVLQQYNNALQVKMNDQHVDLSFAPGKAELEAVNRFCFENGITLNHLRLRKKSLETKFFELTQNKQ